MTRLVQLTVVRRLRRRRPNLSGDLDQVLSDAPCFRRGLAGYDRFQVDNYVSWVETELMLAGRELDDLTRRLGQCSADLQRAEEHLATSPAGWELGRVSERVGEILRLAADEAADLVEAGIAEADRVRAQAEQGAAVALRQAQEVRAMAAVESDRLRQVAHEARVEAVDALQRARAEAAALVRKAEEEWARVEAESVQAHARATQELATAHVELALAHGRHVQTERAVERLTRELDSTLVALTTPVANLLAVVPDDVSGDVHDDGPGAVADDHPAQGITAGHGDRGGTAALALAAGDDRRSAS
jgi:cell division septum initiation protein DivIVA